MYSEMTGSPRKWPILLKMANSAESARGIAHWTYFMQIFSNYNTKSLYHIENSVIVAIKNDIVKSIKVTSRLQFEKNETNLPDGADRQKNQKQILKLVSPLHIDETPGVQAGY